MNDFLMAVLIFFETLSTILKYSSNNVKRMCFVYSLIVYLIGEVKRTESQSMMMAMYWKSKRYSMMMFRRPILHISWIRFIRKVLSWLNIISATLS